jgi:hypothetical protein
VLKITLLFLIVSCSAPELATQTDLAGAQPIASGPLFEEQGITLPSAAWTAAVPLTLVAPGGANLAILDRLGVRVEVSQVRSGRVLVRCSGCTGTAMNAEGWLPRGVLWAPLPSPTEAEPTAKDPLSLSLSLRAQWAAGIGLPEGSTADAFCGAIDQGWRVDTNQAVVEHEGGKIKLVRTGADWAMVQQDTPPATTAGSCG